MNEDLSKVIDDINRTANRFRSLPSKTTDSGVELIGHIPHVTPEAYLIVLHPGLTEAQICQLEDEIERPVPLAYREFLKIHNGASFFKASLGLYGLRSPSDRVGDEARQPWSARVPNVYERQRRLAKDDVIIAGYSEDGSDACIRAKDGQVILISRQSRLRTLFEWESFTDYMISELRRLSGYFDDEGKFLNPELRSARQILTFAPPPHRMKALDLNER